MLPDFPKSKKLIGRQINEFSKAAMKFHSGAFFRDVPHRIMHEGNSFVSEYSESLSHTTDIKKIESSFQWDIEEVLKNKALLFEKLSELARHMADQQTRLAIETISDVTEKVGNVVRSTGDVTPEDIFGMYEKVQIDFNADGTPRMPSIIAGDAMLIKIRKALEIISNDAEYKKKFDAIIETQKAQWNDRENNRKLVG
jgi:hypothetical protein